jgi:hypothetical protein
MLDHAIAHVEGVVNPSMRFIRRHEAAKYLTDKYGFGAYRTLAKGAVSGDTPSFHRPAESCSIPEKLWTFGRSRKSASLSSRPPKQPRLEAWKIQMRRDPPACAMRPAAPRYRRCWAAPVIGIPCNQLVGRAYRRCRCAQADRERHRPPRACPACGVEVFVVYTVRVAAGELVELGARQSGKSAPADWEKKVFFSELMALKKPRYKSGWASAQFREKFGHWPPREWASLPTLSPSLNTRNWLKSRQIAFAKRRAS